MSEPSGLRQLVTGTRSTVQLALDELAAGNTSACRELLLPLERRLRNIDQALTGAVRR